MSPGRQGPSPWTPDVVALFRELLTVEPVLEYALIAQRINDRLGTKITKNAAIGFGRRLGVPKRNPTPKRRPKTVRKLRPLPRVPKMRLSPRIVLEPPRPRRKPGEKIDIMELTSATCRWPFGDRPPFLFCGEATFEDNPYCLGHCRVAYPAMARAAPQPDTQNRVTSQGAAQGRP